MPAERTTMRQVREVLRLKFVGSLSNHEIARRLGVAPSTVRATLKRLRAAGLSWPLPDDMADVALEARLFAAAGTKQGHRRASASKRQSPAHHRCRSHAVHRINLTGHSLRRTRASKTSKE
jgi:DNA-binding transcriptional regulator LsrR (DeoR family)